MGKGILSLRKVYHVSKSGKGLEEAILISNHYNEKSYLPVVRIPGEGETVTGGILFEKNDKIKAIFDAIPNEDHYEIALLLRHKPSVGQRYFLE